MKNPAFFTHPISPTMKKNVMAYYGRILGNAVNIQIYSLPMTVEPMVFLTGILSPVIRLSSHVLSPFTRE